MTTIPAGYRQRGQSSYGGGEALQRLAEAIGWEPHARRDLDHEWIKGRLADQVRRMEALAEEKP